MLFSYFVEYHTMFLFNAKLYKQLLFLSNSEQQICKCSSCHDIKCETMDIKLIPDSPQQDTIPHRQRPQGCWFWYSSVGWEKTSTSSFQMPLYVRIENKCNTLRSNKSVGLVIAIIVQSKIYPSYICVPLFVNLSVS